VQLGGLGWVAALGIRAVALNHQCTLYCWFLLCLSVLTSAKNNNRTLRGGTLLATPQLPLDYRFPGYWMEEEEMQD